MDAWACDRCDEVHVTNPNACRSCGHHVFRPLSAGELERRTEGGEAPGSVEPETTVGSTAEPEFDSSPGVAPDGSVERDEQSERVRRRRLLDRLLGWLR
jgi:hypothetical protein